MNALEFADMIERYNAGVMSQKICEDYKDAADELRRLAAVEAELVALKKSLAAAPAAPSEVDMDEYRAMVAAMERIDPATLPGLTAEQRCALSRFVKPAGGLAGNAQPKRRPYNASGSLSEYGIFPDCDAAPGRAGRAAPAQEDRND